MKVAYFHTGLHLTLHNAPYRIDRILESGECYLERLSDRSISVKTKLELGELLASDDLTLVGKSYDEESSFCENRSHTDLAGLSEEQQKIVLRRLEYINQARSLFGETPTRLNLQESIERVAEKLDDPAPPSPITLYKWWKKWLLSNRDLTALRDNQPGKIGGRRFRGVVETEFQKVVDEIYLSKQKPSKQQVYEAFCHRMSELNMARLKPLRVPSRAQFYRMLDRIDKYDVLAAREGKQVADKHFRATGAGVVTKHILERIEVDHTSLDVIVVSERTGLPEGRPTLTLLLDRYSRMPLGFEIGFEVPSELSVMRALRNAILPKAYIKDSYPEIEHSWPAYGIPNTLICDNGLEFHSHQLRRMCAELNIELQFCPKKQPHYKGAVERFLGTLNRAVCHRIPGATFSNIRQRGEYDSAGSAKITLSDLKSLIHQWIIDIYCQQVHRITNRTPEALWQDGLKMVEPLLPESLSQLNLILTRELKRKLTHQGVQVFGLFYNSSELALLRTRSNDAYEVTVRYDPENMGYVWVYDELNGDYILVPCIQPEYAEGLTLRQHKQIHKDAKQRGMADQDDIALLASKARFHKKIEDLSRNKLLRERKKAARDIMPADAVTPAWRSNSTLSEKRSVPEKSGEPIVPLTFEVDFKGDDDEG